LLINGLKYFLLKLFKSDESVEIVKLTIELIDSVGLHRRQLAIERNEEIDLQI
jgi:hypothetical protein